MARDVRVGGGAFAVHYSDPLGDMNLVHKMEKFSDFCAIDPGYYDVPSNPAGRVRTAKPANGIARINLSHIDPNNGFQKPLYDALKAIGGFVTQSQYPGYNMPDFTRANVRALVGTYAKDAGADFAGVMLTDIDNITNVSNHTTKDLIDGLFASLKDIKGGLPSGKKMILGGGLYVSTYSGVNVMSQLAQITPNFNLTFHHAPHRIGH